MVTHDDRYRRMAKRTLHLFDGKMADPAAVVVILVAALLQTGILGLPTVEVAVATTLVQTKTTSLESKKEMDT
jgi:hypothetical protein